MNSSIPYPEYVEGKSDAQDLAKLINLLRKFAVLTYRAVFTAVTTLTAAPATLWTSDPMPLGTAWEVSIEALAYATDGNVGGYRRIGRFKRVAGACAQVGITRTPVPDDEDIAGWDVALAPLGNGVTFTVTGDVGRTVDWSALVEIREL